jgi:hypothetical protein
MIPVPFVKLTLYLNAVLPALNSLSQSEYSGRTDCCKIPKLIDLLRKKTILLQEDERRLKARLMLDIMLRGLAVLTKMDQEVMRLVGKPIHARYGIDDIACVYDFYFDEGGAKVCPYIETNSDVDVKFSTTTVFLDACEDRLDFLAAVGEGRIVVKGLVPLADRMSMAFEKLKYYL